MLNILTGSVCVMFVMTLVDAPAVVHVTAPGMFLEGLSAAKAVLGFSELDREEADLTEVFPWTGNV